MFLTEIQSSEFWNKTLCEGLTVKPACLKHSKGKSLVWSIYDWSSLFNMDTNTLSLRIEMNCKGEVLVKSKRWQSYCIQILDDVSILLYLRSNWQLKLTNNQDTFISIIYKCFIYIKSHSLQLLVSCLLLQQICENLKHISLD